MNINEVLKSDYDLLCKDYKKATKKIEKLEEENKVLKELNVCVGCEDNPTYKARIDKAIEYIKQYGNLYCLKGKQFKDYQQYKDLLDILKGSDTNG